MNRTHSSLSIPTCQKSGPSYINSLLPSDLSSWPYDIPTFIPHGRMYIDQGVRKQTNIFYLLIVIPTFAYLDLNLDLHLLVVSWGFRSCTGAAGIRSHHSLNLLTNFSLLFFLTGICLVYTSRRMSRTMVLSGINMNAIAATTSAPATLLVL